MATAAATTAALEPDTSVAELGWFRGAKVKGGKVRVGWRVTVGAVGAVGARETVGDMVFDSTSGEGISVAIGSLVGETVGGMKLTGLVLVWLRVASINITMKLVRLQADPTKPINVIFW
jgi:hypothetical protein